MRIKFESVELRKILVTLTRRQEPETSDLSPQAYYAAIQGALERFSSKLEVEQNRPLKEEGLEGIEEFRQRLGLLYQRLQTSSKGKKRDYDALVNGLQNLLQEIDHNDRHYTRRSVAQANERRRLEAKILGVDNMDTSGWLTNEAYWEELRPPEFFMRLPTFYNEAPIRKSKPLENDSQFEAFCQRMLSFAVAPQRWKVIKVDFDPATMKWKTKKYVGGGGSGRVFAVAVGDRVESDGEADLSVAVKKINCHDNLEKGERIEEFCRAMLKTRRHPHVVNLIAQELDKKAQEYRVFMEFVSGTSLSNLTAKIGPFPSREARLILSQITRGLQYLHSLAIVHRDLKADNILINLDGCIKICDMDTVIDLSKSTSSESSQTAVGTAFWLSPEAARGVISPRSDIWSLGCVAIEILTKKAPWQHAHWHTRDEEAVRIELINMDSDEAVRGPPLPDNFDDDWKDFLSEVIFVGHDKRVGASILLEDPWFNPLSPQGLPQDSESTSQ